MPALRRRAHALIPIVSRRGGHDAGEVIVGASAAAAAAATTATTATTAGAAPRIQVARVVAPWIRVARVVAPRVRVAGRLLLRGRRGRLRLGGWAPIVAA